MEMIPLTPERKAQLDDYAQPHEPEPAAALDEVLADALEWERQDYQEGLRACGRDTRSSRPDARPIEEEAFEELREKHDLPR